MLEWWTLNSRKKSQNIKNPKEYFCKDHWEENSGEAIEGEAFLLPYGPMLMNKENIREKW